MHQRDFEDSERCVKGDMSFDVPTGTRFRQTPKNKQKRERENKKQNGNPQGDGHCLPEAKSRAS